MNGPSDLTATMIEKSFEWGALIGERVKRVGVVDVGSNSVRLVVFDGVARSPAYFYNEKVLCGLGAGINETGLLNPKGRARAMLALHRFVALAELMKVSGLTCVATAAVREARDGPDFCDRVFEETGLRLNVASGEEEARLSAQGVLLGWPHANGVVCDIGGASMELAEVTDGRIGKRATSPLGPLQLANLSDSEIDAEIVRNIEALKSTIGAPISKLFLVGGSWRAIARLDMERQDYPLKVLHEYRMHPEALKDTAAWLSEQAPEDLNDLTETSQARLNLVPLAARVLSHLIDALRPPVITVSSYGIREGMLYEVMPDELRRRDPLLEAASHMEQASARFPGFGDTLYEWLEPLYLDRDEEERRLIRAACRLHDITWRAHPDYRAEVCFESVTRANLSGLSHEGRIFLGLAILHRYKGNVALQFDPALLALLDEDRRQEAETLGRAMRLGAMLSGAVSDALKDTQLILSDDTLTLELRGQTSQLQGEIVERRLSALAHRVGKNHHIDLKP